jgi:hypothetical protein
VSTLWDGKVYANTSVHLAFYDVKRAIGNGYGVRVLYGASGSGSTTTLHAAVLGKRLDGTAVVGDRAIVFQTRAFKALRHFQAQLGKHWVGLSGIDTALKLLHLLVAPLEEGTFQRNMTKLRGHLTIPSAYDPNTVENLALQIHPFAQVKATRKGPRVPQRPHPQTLLFGGWN